MALTAAQYKAEMDAAFTKYVERSGKYNIELGMAWAQIASVYGHLYAHQLLFDREGAVESPLALGYRKKAEDFLIKAKGYSLASINAPSAVAACQAASVAAYVYCQIVKVESDKV